PVNPAHHADGGGTVSPGAASNKTSLQQPNETTNHVVVLTGGCKISLLPNLASIMLPARPPQDGEIQPVPRGRLNVSSQALLQELICIRAGVEVQTHTHTHTHTHEPSEGTLHIRTDSEAAATV
ncbi:hypothetical protein CHARACLAT_026903, partial [Characodon lateralis]|nr:hypothetical protein [Characodon lateralis]